MSMLSHLRFHRRGHSNPTSPAADQPSPWESAAFHDHPHRTQDVSPRPDSRAESQLPPTLPPITRVTSADTLSNLSPRQDDATIRNAHQEDGNMGFTGGYSFQYGGQARKIPQGALAGPYPPSLPENQLTRVRPAPPPIYTGSIQAYRPVPSPTQQQGRAASSFVTPTDLQHQSFAGQIAKRPTGTRMASEPAISPNPAVDAPTKGKKRLPFFKTQVASLLTRSKPLQPLAEPEPLRSKKTVDQPAYDPRIRGTRVHDFSLPRKKVPPPPVAVSAASDIVAQENCEEQSPLATGAAEGDADRSGSGESLRTQSALSRPLQATEGYDERSPTDVRRSSVDKPLPPQPKQDTLSLGDRDSSTGASSFVTATPALSREASSVLPRTNSSFRLDKNGSVIGTSGSRRTSTMSAVPRHMKSTSSRFSFDMVGAAKQERLLEERHRKREAEKNTTDAPRDSRFDDLDDDSFEYDSIMDDDGLEERIPGVNADAEDDSYDYDALAEDVNEYEEEIPGVNADIDREEDFGEELDPDNDQENFAGFTFQRSNPTSNLASPLTPGLLQTPRDTNGAAIGFALTKDTTPGIGPSPSPSLMRESLELEKAEGSGLGIQNAETDTESTPVYETAIFQERGPSHLRVVSSPAPSNDDEIYFDDGLADELNFEHDGTYFDESIFDINDTDQYGRPIPGAFAQAKTLMSAQHQSTKRDSGLTADLTVETFEHDQSGIAISTAHTSLSGALRPPASVAEDDGKEPESVDPERTASCNPGILGQQLAYQAALAAAAQKAAASGKFRRSSSPGLPPDMGTLDPPDSDNDQEADAPAVLDEPLEGYEDDDSFARNAMDDYELDDDFIAEANAEALANDSEGWYGQEFGFYSAPLAPASGQGHHAATSSSPKPLTLENLYQYANGGYFGPSGGLDRTKSGRIVSREPNLTPITEMSEYSNRNSVMSLGVLSGSAPVQSPGLAQLALMDDDPHINIDALMRLRSKTFGGSQASLVSSREGGAGSPRSERPPEGFSSSWAQQSMHGGTQSRKNSIFSLMSASEIESGAGSPTLTLSMPAPVQHSLAPVAAPPVGLGPSPMVTPTFGHTPFPPVSPKHFSGQTNPISPVEEEYEVIPAPSSEPRLESLAGSPIWTKSPIGGIDGQQRPVSPVSPKRLVKGHRHKGSADSISYIKDEESADGRWILERRRTAETGEVEILEREVVEGGRI